MDKFESSLVIAWLEEIQLPSEGYVFGEAENMELSNEEKKGFMKCYNYILGFINNKK